MRSVKKKKIQLQKLTYHKIPFMQNFLNKNILEMEDSWVFANG